MLLHGFPDSSKLWDSQVAALAAAGLYVIVPDMPGYGQSDKPISVNAYTLKRVCSALCSVLDALGVQAACVVGHDWGAATAWALALQHPQRVSRLVVLSVGHPGIAAAAEPKQRAHWWYMLFFTLPGAEAALTADDWALFRQVMGQGCGQQQVQQYVDALSQPGALAAALNWYRANTQARHFGQTLPWPVNQQSRVACPVLGIWSSDDTALLEAQMTQSARYVAPGCWQYLKLDSVGHWIPRDAPQQLNKLLLSFLSEKQGKGHKTSQGSTAAPRPLSKL
ncbi:putative hydrolase or acyltransferase of alpha/beta superfamily [Scenedesmus sp. NREL 46B-D3]|nr:putative hydrolase or acyltransferase of alpha/beta superfamily [Scenedesmus sp. NREL 46B-D3]